MTRLAIKLGLATLSVAATLIGWGLMAYRDMRGAAPRERPVVKTLDLPAIPEVSEPPLGVGGMASQVQENLAWNLPSMPSEIVRPLTRTRSSR